MDATLVDRYGRRHDYLRISVTDRCDLRCVYCMGSEGVPLLDHSKILSYEEIGKVVTAAARLGIKKIRLSGGEPLVRKGIEKLIKQISCVPGIEDLAMTTNGQLLEKKIPALKEAGLKRVNISLDSLDPLTYREITRGGDLGKVLRALEASLAHGLAPVKINVVLMRDVNEAEIPAFFQLARNYPIHLRFIEYMPMGCQNIHWRGKYLPLEAVKEQAQSMGAPLEPLAEEGDCRGPAQLYRLPGAQGLIGLIHPISQHFCSQCNRLRLTADGFIKPCLYWEEEISLKPVLDNMEELQNLLRHVLDYKKEKHAMRAGELLETSPARSMSKIGG